MSDITAFRLKARDGIALAALACLLGLMLGKHAHFAGREALLVTSAFALGGWFLRGVSGSGAVAGGMVAFIFYSIGGRRMFATLFAVFVLTLMATLAGRKRKQALGLAEARAGRSASQVAANLFVAAAALVLLPTSIAVVVAVAALAEATADTVSSEMGQAFGTKTRLVTTLRPVAPGTNGGLSSVGTLAGMLGAGCVASAGLLLLEPRMAAIAAIAGIMGMLVDSVLGATLENRHFLNNDAVNFLGTLTAAAVAGSLV